MAEERRGVRKGKRIPLRIYKLKIDTVQKIDIYAEPNLIANQYLSDKDIGDIFIDTDGNKVIEVSITNLPPNTLDEETVKLDFPQTFEVYEDEYGNPFIEIGNNRIFIQTPSFEKFLGRESQKVFEFHLNPESFKPDFKKLVTEIRTRGGWEIQHWGEALTDITVSGRSGAMIKKLVNGQEVPLTDNDYVEDSIAWKKLTELSSLYKRDHLIKNKPTEYLLGLSVYDNFYIGYFTSFTGPVVEAERPYIVSYSFSFKVQNTIKLGTRTLFEDNVEV
ncbi:MAG: hypothetical protein M0Q88_07075 [Bacilli bacterium]|nr:hypothetical protein [Bacilli bacterium]